MNVLETRMNLRALCYEHHVEMKLTWFLFTTQTERGQVSAFHCSEPGCSVHYNSSRGYFRLSRDRGQMETDSVPHVKCAHDGAQMYLAEVQPERTHVRIWQCPQCNANHTNGKLSRALKPIADADGRITLWRCSDCAWTAPAHSEFADMALWQASRKAFHEHNCASHKESPQKI